MGSCNLAALSARSIEHCGFWARYPRYFGVWFFIFSKWAISSASVAQPWR